MFGKFYASAFEGSMRGAGADVFAVWAYVLSHTVNSRVELNPEDAAPRIGMSVKEVEQALEHLQNPDEKSRSKEHDGKRMVKEGEFSYFIPTHRAYLLMKNSEDLRQYNARKQRESRNRKKWPGKGVPMSGEQAYLDALESGNQTLADKLLDNQPNGGLSKEEKQKWNERADAARYAKGVRCNINADDVCLTKGCPQLRDANPDRDCPLSRYPAAGPV